ncbi:MAG: hypothetical protein LBH05_06655 [Deferribacteraceae bacterium]|jgi:hypothetical protein|nr:hypothetical protein [Deferribacteraceae bacterium]
MQDSDPGLTLLERLAKAGIQIIAAAKLPEETQPDPSQPEDKTCFFTVRGRKVYLELPKSAVLCTSVPYYRGNRGFFHIKEGDGECILLKSCYDDFIRIVKKGITLSNESLNGISRTLSQIEGLLEGLFEVVFFNSDGQTFIFEVNKAEPQYQDGLFRDPLIPRPLTATEYCDSMSDLIPDKSLFSRSMLQIIFPEQVSFFMVSLFKKYSEILNPFFLFFDAKVDSPSVKCIDFRPYVNITALLRGFSEIKSDRKLFCSFYMPWQKIFSGDKPKKAELFISKRISVCDIESFMDEVEKEYLKKDSYNLYEADYFDPVIKMSMMAMILNFIFQEQFAYFADYVKAAREDALRWIYKTRGNSFFIKGEKLTLPVYFDLATAPEEVQFFPYAAASDKDVIFPHLSAFSRWRRKKKAFKLLDSLHKILDLRDRLLKNAADYHSKTRKYILDSANYMVNRGKFQNDRQVFLFDVADLRRITNDTFYTSLAPMLEYKESLLRRSAAQIMPYEIYEVDIPYAGMIAEDQYFKSGAEKSYKCESYNTADITGEAFAFDAYVTDGAVSGEKIYCSRAIPLASVAKLNKPQAVITDIAPAFSYITEYCLINDIPLYFGIRYCDLLLAGKKVKLGKNKAESL